MMILYKMISWLIFNKPLGIYKPTPCFMDVITISIMLVMLAGTVLIEYDFAVQE